MLEVPNRVIVLIISVLVALLLGDYLGYKIGRRRLALISATIALITIVVYTIYAVVVVGL